MELSHETESLRVATLLGLYDDFNYDRQEILRAYHIGLVGAAADCRNRLE